MLMIGYVEGVCICVRVDIRVMCEGVCGGILCMEMCIPLPSAHRSTLAVLLPLCLSSTCPSC